MKFPACANECCVAKRRWTGRPFALPLARNTPTAGAAWAANNPFHRRPDRAGRTRTLSPAVSSFHIFRFCHGAFRTQAVSTADTSRPCRQRIRTVLALQPQTGFLAIDGPPQAIARSPRFISYRSAKGFVFASSELRAGLRGHRDQAHSPSVGRPVLRDRSRTHGLAGFSSDAGFPRRPCRAISLLRPNLSADKRICFDRIAFIRWRVLCLAGRSPR